ncbi:unnamed protein product [Penicillium bialowiezense]
MTPSKPSSSVIIIGGGFSGLAMACQLQRKFNLDDYVIYDRNAGIGGAWWANTYPGCGVDIPGICYSLSFAPNTEFTKFFPSQSEILNYIHRVAIQCGVCNHFSGETEWVGATWQEEKQSWLVKLKDLKTGDQFTQECRILISGVGGLVNPRNINIRGSETLKGSIIHTARWQNDIDLRDKQVSVIGNGASAIQLIPEIVKEAKSVTQFMRFSVMRDLLMTISGYQSPHHLVERPNYEISSFWQFIFSFLPGVLWIIRLLMLAYMEWSFLQSQASDQGHLARVKAERESKDYVYKTAPEKYWGLLIPTFEFGCRRRVFDRSYTASLHRDNLALTDDPIVQIKPQTIVTASKKEIPTDIIILATGFELTQYEVEIKGRNGKTRDQYWKEAEGKATFKTVAMSDFPNFFYVLGPNSGRVYTSTLLIIERQEQNLLFWNQLNSC